MTKTQVIRRIGKTIKRYSQAVSNKSYALIPLSVQAGKLYEAHVLSVVLKHLHKDEGLKIRLVNSNFIPLKTGHGPINPRYPHFDLLRHGVKVAELWTDVEFTSLSYAARNVAQPPDAGEFHELDLVVVEPGISGHPRFDQIWLAVECKDRSYGKHLLREILGIRRELSFFDRSQQTKFDRWPSQYVSARPPSCLLVYSTSPAVTDYSSPGQMFGIDFKHEPLC